MGFWTALISVMLGVLLGAYIAPVRDVPGAATVIELNNTINRMLYNGSCVRYLEKNITILKDYYKTIKVYENVSETRSRRLKNLNAGTGGCKNTGCANGYYLAKYDAMEIYGLPLPKYSERPPSGFQALLNRTETPCVLAKIVNGIPQYELNASTWYILRDADNPFYHTNYGFDDLLAAFDGLNLTWDVSLNKSVHNRSYARLNQSVWDLLHNRSAAGYSDKIVLRQYDDEI